MKDIRQPMNATEEYLYATVMRLDALCHMMSTFIEEYAKQNKVTVESNTVKKKTAPRKKKVEE